ncbi:MAG: hypothetical protein Q4B50_02240 [Bacillota bacterium]|nr:hypothetical protein [Bacillota bacterium]
MEILNKPIEMISICSVNGDLRPIRFRFEDESHHPRIVRIQEILSTKESLQLGIQSFLYLCHAVTGERDLLFELRYIVKSHSWVLYRIIY